MCVFLPETFSATFQRRVAATASSLKHVVMELGMEVRHVAIVSKNPKVYLGYV